jgi:hypothetical protein
VAGLVAAGIAPRAMDPRLGGLVGELVALAVTVAVCAFLLRGGRSGDDSSRARPGSPDR